MTRPMTIAEFCDKFNACPEGRDWALATGCTTMPQIWQRKDMRNDWRVWIATQHGVFTDRELRLFACWCVRQVWHLLTDERSHHAVEVAERYAAGTATDEELAAARDAAGGAAGEAAGAAARAAAGDAAWAVAEAAAEVAAWVAARVAWAAAWDAAGGAAGEAAGEAAWAAAWGAAGVAARVVARVVARDAAWDAARAAAWDAARDAQSNFLLKLKFNFEQEEKL